VPKGRDLARKIESLWWWASKNARNFYSDGDKSEKVGRLNRLIQEAENPSGLLASISLGISAVFYLRPLQEYETDGTTLAYLNKLQSVVARALAATGAVLPDLQYAEGLTN